MKKTKAITFSYDDGVEQDKRLIKILDKYGLKCTFNLNSGQFGIRTAHQAAAFGITTVFRNQRIPFDEIKQVYENHEVAAHSVNHPLLPSLADEDVIFQMREDAANLEKIVGYQISGFAYPGGRGEYYNEHVKNLIKNNTRLYYGRMVTTNHSFDLQEDLLRFEPTVSHREKEMREKLAKEFLELETDTPKIYYLWGHSYELDVAEQEWCDFEHFCEMIAGRNDVFYGTNDQVFRYFGLNK